MLLFSPSLSGCQETSALGTEYLHFFYIAQDRNYLTLSILPVPPSQFLEITHRRKGAKSQLCPSPAKATLLRIHPRDAGRLVFPQNMLYLQNRTPKLKLFRI